MQTSRFGLRLAMALVSLLGLTGVTFGLWPQDAPSDLLKTADKLAERVAALRGLQPKGPIQKGVRSRGEISKFLEDHVRDDYDEGQLKREGKALQKLGLIPPSIDYKDFTLKLLTEQVGGYYDPEKKVFYIAGWLPLDQQRTVMIHELTHALQDQYFDIGRFQKEDRKLNNDDRALAHQAFFEGDATAVMLDDLVEPMGKNFAQLPNPVSMMRSQFSSLEAQFEIFKQAPMFLKEELMFPYGYGAAFLQKARGLRPWEEVNKIYSDLPVSTEQIMHPEKYLEKRDDPQPVSLKDPAVVLGSGWKTTYRNVLGEFVLYLMLKQQLAEEKAAQAAAGWDGDQLLLVENSNGAAAIFFSSIWDSPEDAEEFYRAMGDWFKVRFPDARRSDESDSGFNMFGDGEFHLLRREKDRVRFIVGLPESQSAQFKSW